MKEATARPTTVVIRLPDAITRSTIEQQIEHRDDIEVIHVPESADALSVALTLREACTFGGVRRMVTLGQFEASERELLLTEFPDLEVINLGTSDDSGASLSTMVMAQKKLGQSLKDLTELF